MTLVDGATVTVAVPARNAAHTIADQLGALAEQDYEHQWDVLVVDNGSDDSTVDVAMRWADALPSLRVLSAGSRVGSNYTRNVAMRAASTDVVAFCDADDVVDKGWLRALVTAMRDADAAGGRLDYDRLNSEDDRTRRPEPPMAGLPVGANFLPRPIGANCAVRKQVWHVLGGFDESYQLGGTETEFFWRLQLAGYTITFAADAVVHYRFRRGWRPLFHQYARFGRAQAQLYRDFRQCGMPRTAVRSFARDAAWLTAHAADLVREPGRQGRWIRTAATRWGRLVGSARHGVVYL